MWKRSLLRGSRAIVGTTVRPHCKDLVLRTIVSTVASVPADPSQQKKRERDRGHNPSWFQQIGLQISPRHGCDRHPTVVVIGTTPDAAIAIAIGSPARPLAQEVFIAVFTMIQKRGRMIRTDSSQASNPLRSNPDPKPNQAGSSNGRPKRNQVARTAAANNNKNNSNNNNNNNNGMSKEECSRILERACSEIRGIVLTKRQRSKPWIMALLLHRYDRGIRDPHELHTDSVYWKRNNTNNHDSGDSRSSNHTHTRTHAAAAAAAVVAHSKWVAPDGIDLREVMTPHPQHVRGFLDENNPSSSSSSSESENKSSYETEVVELLRREKLALLATEGRRIVVDRKLKLPNTSNTKNIINNNNNNKPNGKTLRTPTTTTTERDARKLSKKDPALFLSLVAMALANAERNKNKNKNDTPEDFSHRRHHPPSLKTAVYHKAKLREKHRKAAAQKATAAGKTNGNHQKRRYPAEVRNKLAAMRQTR
eukprot:jgi/Psemu1/10184/gm1.10184_g